MLDVDAYQVRLREWSSLHGWSRRGNLGGPGDLDELFYLNRNTELPQRPRLYLSAGIHGDEPAGPEAILKLLQHPEWVQDWEVHLFPLLNPSGFRLGRRENAEGLDLNRDYGQAQSLEIQRHQRILQTLPRMDLALCLHEDWEARGCYLYFLDEQQRIPWARSVLEAMHRVLPVDPSAEIDGMAAEQGLITRRVEEIDRPDWPEAIYLARKLSDCCFTLETPSSHDLDQRVATMLAGVREALTFPWWKSD
ncbi:MAG: M14 family metallocarboxypeptidase [Blastochloris sp.]|nr:M14 family metallocarboxypeptidase [Blastochloris sp.]